MIKKLRIKFIVLSMVAVFVLIAIIVAGMNILNYRAVIHDAQETLAYLASNKGSFPEMMRPDGGFVPNADFDDDFDDDDFRPGGGQGFPAGMSPETPYESRFFSVLMTEDGTVLYTDIDRIAAVSEEDAVEYAEEVLQEGRTKGFIKDYLFVKNTEEGGVRITFLDCGRKIESLRMFLIISTIVAAVGYVLFFFVIFFFSKRIIRPVAESYEKQKRFITDAGHEIKTPLAIIKADADVLEMDNENNEWIEDIQKQTVRLTALTNDLVSLARMEEAKDLNMTEEVALSDLVEEETDAYQMLAQSSGKTIDLAVQPAVFVKGNEKALRRLVNILMDNAMKYSPENTSVSVTMNKTGRQVQLSVWNATTEPVTKENLELLFDRFYRTDSSRNSETGGHGIGLSMAKAITEAHSGKIKAVSEDGKSLKIEVVIPG